MRIELLKQKLIGMINRIDNVEELQRLIDQLYEQEQEKKRESGKEKKRR